MIIILSHTVIFHIPVGVQFSIKILISTFKSVITVEVYITSTCTTTCNYNIPVCVRVQSTVYL